MRKVSNYVLMMKNVDVIIDILEVVVVLPGWKVDCNKTENSIQLYSMFAIPSMLL